MCDPDKNNGQPEFKQPHRPQSNKPIKDLWDKLDVLAKISLPLVMGMLGFLFNYNVSKKQETENNIKLYTQLLSDKETAENTLRKDMFSKILESFIGDQSKSQAGIDKIKEMRLSLELLSRNFHESLDMKPLFRHLLMEIIGQSLELRRAKKQLNEALAANTGDVNKLRAAVKQAQVALANFYRQQGADIPLPAGQHSATERDEAVQGDDSVLQGHSSAGSSQLKLPTEVRNLREAAARENERINSELSRYDTELRELMSIARRVSRKQREVLEDVAQTIKMPLSNQDQALKLINTKYKPTERLPRIETTNRDAGCIIKEQRLAFRDSSGNEIKGSARHFKIRVRYAYPKWHQIHVEVESWKCLENCSTKNCVQCGKESAKETTAFWLDQFDFPLVDNTFIDNEHRYSVVLEELEVNQAEEIENATITLLYYPASYAGLKEKSFYNNQLLNNLLKWNMFRKD